MYNTVEGNSDDEGMDDNLGEPDYMNMTPEGSAIGSGALEESRKRKKTSPLLDSAPDPNEGAMAATWQVVAGLRLWGETARHNVQKKKKIDLNAYAELTRSLERLCASIEAREAYLVGRLAERAEIKNIVADEVGRAMERLEGMFERERVVGHQRATFAEVTKPKVSFPNIRAQPIPRENVLVVYPPGGPKEGPRDASVETKKRIVELIKPREVNLQVRNFRTVSKGGVLVEAASSQAAGKIFENQALKDGGFQVARPKVVLPKVMVYDVPNDISEDEVRNCLKSQNPTLRPNDETIQAGLRLVKRMPVRDRSVEQWVLECNPAVRDWLMSEGRVYIDWSPCRVRLFEPGVRSLEQVLQGKADLCPLWRRP